MEAGHLHQGLFETHCCSRRGLVGSSVQPRGIRWMCMVSKVLVRFGRLNHALVGFSTSCPLSP
jgi:hypothetical protein